MSKPSGKQKTNDRTMIKNALSIDVEEYYHANNLEHVAPRKDWPMLSSRVEAQTMDVLDLLAHHQTKATFFILGHVARRKPDLVRKIADEGHEIASHGYFHRLAYEQSPKGFFNDVRKAKLLLEDLSGEEVIGYRAPSFSITEKNTWAYDCLIRCGYAYDSSLYPIKHPRYGNSDKPLAPHVLERDSGHIAVIPLAVRQLLSGLRLPAAGGAYWRLFPVSYTCWALKGINSRENRSFVCYFHPWEIDPNQPHFEELSRQAKIRHYRGLGSFISRLNKFLATFSFAPIREICAREIGKASASQQENC